MPIYVYQCEKCRFTFEERGSFDDLPEKKCRSEGCTGRAVRVIQPVASVVKWVRTRQADGSAIYSK